jgi:hypothetical protein
MIRDHGEAEAKNELESSIALLRATDMDNG